MHSQNELTGVSGPSRDREGVPRMCLRIGGATRQENGKTDYVRHHMLMRREDVSRCWRWEAAL